MLSHCILLILFFNFKIKSELNGGIKMVLEMERKMEFEFETETKATAIPEGYAPKLDFFETEKAIKLVKDTFERELAEELDLVRVTSPRFLKVGKGLQDDLAGTQVPVRFKTKASEKQVEIVHSLAKWKRYTLGKFGFPVGKGLYTDMDAIRKDEVVSPIHSVYVDQWDWEKVISREERSILTLESVVSKIYKAIKDTEAVVHEEYHVLERYLPEKIHFVHTEELEEMYPLDSPKEREYKAAELYGAYFLIGIGYPLKSGEPHDARAADYDDWYTETEFRRRGLNGDIIVWDDVRKDALELSSMGIRVDEYSLIEQLKIMGLEERSEKEFHKGIIEGTLPLSIGGGIGQSRLCMLMLQKSHIGEVQSSVWSEETIEECYDAGVTLL